MPRTTYRITQQHLVPGDWRDGRKRLVRMYVDYWEGRITDEENVPFPASAKIALFPHFKDLDECIEIPLAGLSRCVAKKLLDMYQKNEEYYQRDEGHVDANDALIFTMEMDPT